MKNEVKKKKDREVNQISLTERIARLRNGNASDPAYNACTIRTWANIPICEYMAAFEEENESLRELLSLTEEEEEHMTYQDVARKIDMLWQAKGETGVRRNAKRDIAYKAMSLLILPFERCYNERGLCEWRNG